MNKHGQVHIYVYDKVCVYNGVYEGNIPVSMIHLYTRRLATHIRGEVHLSLFKRYVNKYSQRALGLIPTWRPMVFLGRFKENLHFLISYSKLKNKLIEVCTKKCMYKKDVR